MSNALLQNADQDAQAGTRLYAFVNPRSGGRLGERIIAALQQLPGVQVTSMVCEVGYWFRDFVAVWCERLSRFFFFCSLIFLLFFARVFWRG